MNGPFPFAVFMLLAGLSMPARADLAEILKKGLESQAAGSAASPAAVLSNDDMVAGLKEALAKGTHKAIADLGKPDGFLKNAALAIPMPDSLKKVEKLLRSLKQDKLADEFVATLNHAAEQAVPEAANLFADSINQMTLDDARGILQGPNDAATQYFRKTSGSKLVERFRPAVQAATEKAGVTSAYKRLLKKAGPLAKLAGKEATDLDGYVTEKAVDGLFKAIAAEELLIRKDPVARSTDLLKKVFGSLFK